MSVLLLVSIATAAEPDLSGVHLLLGGGLSTAFGSDGVTAPTANGALRLSIGPRFFFDLSAGGGYVSSEDENTRQSLDADGEPTLYDFDREELGGLRVRAAGRITWRVNAEGPVAFCLGFAGGYSQDEESGTLHEETEDDDGEEVITEVGTYTARESGWSAGPSFVGAVWLTDRVSLSTIVDVDAVQHVEASDVTRRTDEATDYDSIVTDSVRTSYGFWPSVGIYVHLRL